MVVGAGMIRPECLAAHRAQPPRDRMPWAWGAPARRPRAATNLYVARHAFAARGYEQTTIRAVAAQAGIDASMVTCDSGCKAPLFAAAATIVSPPFPTWPPPRLAGVAMFLARHFVARWERDPTQDTLVFLLRTAVTDQSVAGQLQITFDRMVDAPLVALAYPNAERRAALYPGPSSWASGCAATIPSAPQPLASTSGDEAVAGVALTIQYATSPRL